MGSTPAVDVFASAAATAQALTLNYAASAYQPTHRVSDFTRCTFYFTIGGTTPASIDWRICGQHTAAGTVHSEAATECLVGVVTHQEIVRHLTDDTGVATTAATLAVHVNLEDVGFPIIQLQAKRTGGAADTSLLAYATFLS
jgi:hypothetical protein